jgi:hypothetical protein
MGSLLAITAVGALSAQSSTAPTAQAIAILQSNCGSSGCHGGASPYSFDVRDPATLQAAQVIEPGNPSASDVILRLESGVMPLGGYKGQPGVKLPAADIQVLKEWIKAGAPIDAPHARAARPFIAESQILDAIIRDLQSTRTSDRFYIRYYAMVNLWNSADIEQTEFDVYRGALSKLVNHLSWEREIVPPKPLGPENTVLRIDLRDYGWTAETWKEIVESYPYGLETQNLAVPLDRIQELSGVRVPYVRLDWFITTASRAPLYHTILRLPGTLDGLERLLGINVEWEIDSNLARRFGVRNSGVSRNNRAMERHSTINGAYWKSFDFAGNNPEQNIFRNPLDLRADGGEVIFSLPNSLQGYFIVDRKGSRIDDAPVGIVRDKTNPDDPVVHNGRSCMGCHIKGTNGFRDEISSTLQARTESLFNLDIAEALYPGQPELDRYVDLDSKRFVDALKHTGSPVPNGAGEEPISALARRYEGTLTVAQAAADLYIQDPRQLQERIANSPELKLQGFDQLLGAKGGIKRDSWEEGFGLIAQELRLGEFLIPTDFMRRQR